MNGRRSDDENLFADSFSFDDKKRLNPDKNIINEKSELESIARYSPFSFCKVYPSSSYDPVSGLFDKKEFAEISDNLYERFGVYFNISEIMSVCREHEETSESKIASYCGISNPVEFEINEIADEHGLISRNLSYKKLTITKVFLNLAGIEEDKKPGRNMINLFFSPVVFPLNFAYVIYNSLLSTAKLFTELLPEYLEDKLSDWISATKIKGIRRKTSSDNEVNFLNILFFIVRTYKLLGRTITAPIPSAKNGWFTGKKYGENFARWLGIEDKKIITLFGWIGRIVLTGISAITTAGFYIPLAYLLLLGAAPAVGINLAPYLIKFGSLFSNTVIHEFLVALGGKIIAPLLFKLGITSVITSLESLAMGAIAFFTAIGALSLTIIGPVVNELIDRSRSWWRYNHNKSIHDDDNAEKISTTSSFLREKMDCCCFPTLSFGSENQAKIVESSTESQVDNIQDYVDHECNTDIEEEEDLSPRLM